MRRARDRLRSEAGYTLPELITAMVILGVVLGGLTTMFASGMQAEVRANKEFQAQQNARLALDRMRRELHCANAVVALNGVAVGTIIATLPPGCTGADTVVTYATASVAPGRWKLTRAGDLGAAVTVADYLTEDKIFTYYIPSLGTLGRLHVEIPVNLDPSDARTEWRLEDDIVLRNTVRL